MRKWSLLCRRFKAKACNSRRLCVLNYASFAVGAVPGPTGLTASQHWAPALHPVGYCPHERPALFALLPVETGCVETCPLLLRRHLCYLVWQSFVTLDVMNILAQAHNVAKTLRFYFFLLIKIQIKNRPDSAIRKLSYVWNNFSHMNLPFHLFIFMSLMQIKYLQFKI